MGKNTTARRLRLTGKGGEHSFVMVPHYILKSDEFGALTGNALKLLFELAKEYKGGNNGNLSCAFSVLKARGWKSSGTLTAAKQLLLAKGWIICTRHGGSHRCDLFAVTWWPIDECAGKATMYPAEKLARHDWKKNDLGTRYSNRSTRYSNSNGLEVVEKC
jgi:hypothetical protein